MEQPGDDAASKSSAGAVLVSLEQDAATGYTYRPPARLAEGNEEDAASDGSKSSPSREGFSPKSVGGQRACTGPSRPLSEKHMQENPVDCDARRSSAPSAFGQRRKRRSVTSSALVQSKDGRSSAPISSLRRGRLSTERLQVRRSSSASAHSADGTRWHSESQKESHGRQRKESRWHSESQKESQVRPGPDGTRWHSEQLESQKESHGRRSKPHKKNIRRAQTCGLALPTIDSGSLGDFAGGRATMGRAGSAGSGPLSRARSCSSDEGNRLGQLMTADDEVLMRSKPQQPLHKGSSAHSSWESSGGLRHMSLESCDPPGSRKLGKLTVIRRATTIESMESDTRQAEPDSRHLDSPNEPQSPDRPDSRPDRSPASSWCVGRTLSGGSRRVLKVEALRDVLGEQGGEEDIEETSETPRSPTSWDRTPQRSCTWSSAKLQSPRTPKRNCTWSSAKLQSPRRVPRAYWDRDELSVVRDRLESRREPGYALQLESEEFDAFRKALRWNCLCAGLGDAEILDLAKSAELFRFRSQGHVVRRGELGSHLFLVKDGKFRASAGQAAPPQVLSAGNSFGEVPIVHNVRHWESVKAQEAGSTCWGVPKQSLLAALTALAERVYRENLVLLNSVRLFQYISQRQKQNMCRMLVVQMFEPGSVIMTQGDQHGGCMFIIKSGSVDVYVGGFVTATLKEGSLFGDRALLHDDRRSATIVAKERLEVVVVRRRLLHQVLGEDFREVMYRNVVSSLVRGLASEGRLPFSSDIDPESLSKVFVIREFPSNSEVIGSDEAARGLRFGVVLSGEVLVTGPDDSEGQVLQSMECFGEDLLWDPKKPFQLHLKNTSFGYCNLGFLYQDAITSLENSGADGPAMTYKQKVALVRKVFLFRHLSSHHCRLLASNFRAITKHKGEEIISEGHLSSQFFVITSGELGVHAIVHGDRQLRTLGKSDYFGERALLFNEVRTASVRVASEKVELLVIDKSTFLHFVDDKMKQHLEERIRLQNTDVGLADLRVVKEVGRGTFGVVKLVEHKVIGTRYALKCIDRDLAVRNAQQGNLRLEREILLANDHPFIVKVVRTFKDRSYLYFLTEYANGGELYDAIRHLGLLTRQQAAFYTGSLVLALESLHDRGIAFRDLKPENVLLDHHGYTKLIDFGCATKVRGPCHTLVGTPHYMAPEVILGDGYGLTCDQWSLGVCTYEFLCGPLPFGNDLDEPKQVWREILTARLEIPTDSVDAPSADLVKQFLRRDVNKRLGCSSSGWKKVRTHVFFHDFSFDRLLSRQLDPPVVMQRDEELDEGECEGSAEDQASGLGSVRSRGTSSSGLSDVSSDASSSGSGLSDVSSTGTKEEHSQQPAATTSRVQAVKSEQPVARTRRPARRVNTANSCPELANGSPKAKAEAKLDWDWEF